MRGLTGQGVLVSGGSSGIGEATAAIAGEAAACLCGIGPDEPEAAGRRDQRCDVYERELAVT